MSLTQEVALVTGASRGIGKAIALKLARRGAKVVGTATSAEGAQNISAYFKAENLSGVGTMLNVTDNTNVEQTITFVNQTFGSVSILINNAGITRDNLLMRMSEAEWDSIIDTNLKSVFRLSKAVLRGMMKAKRGRIITIGSVVGSSGNPGQVNYAAAKAGIIGFSKSLAREIGSRNITVNTVAPGFIDTEMTQALTTAQRDSLSAQIPLGRLGQVEDIANAVAFLASPEAAYITGETLHVNGGLFMG